MQHLEISVEVPMSKINNVNDLINYLETHKEMDARVRDITKRIFNHEPMDYCISPNWVKVVISYDSCGETRETIVGSPTSLFFVTTEWEFNYITKSLREAKKMWDEELLDFYKVMANLNGGKK